MSKKIILKCITCGTTKEPSILAKKELCDCSSFIFKVEVRPSDSSEIQYTLFSTD